MAHLHCLLRRMHSLLFGLALIPIQAAAVPWFPFGPDGGDARSLAADPHDHMHLYLGTVNGAIYDTHDGGSTWKRLARVGQRDDLVLDNIIVDPSSPNRLYVGAWVLDHVDGGMYTSTDGGRSWTENATMKGHSIRAMSMAPSDSRLLVAGALDGVFQSSDSGNTWKLISPEGSTELHEIESIAIDPKDPHIIYVGTWHLPWKTTDAGQHWNNIKEGIIDDSDVFSIIVDPNSPSTVYASACSGIYKSTDAAEHFSKVQGIPSTARRTRVLMQDPKRASIVFAGTTEGLYRTADGGKTWLRNSNPEWIINDVYVDPDDTDHVLLATDRNGILRSTDGGFTFTSSNRGFSSRQISAYLADRNAPNRIYVGIVNDKEAGGVFASRNGGLSWQQQSAGLGGADVLSLGQAPDGAILAGTRHGIFRFADDHWQSTGLVLLPSSTRERSRTESIAAKGGAHGSPLIAKGHAPVAKGHAPVKRNARNADVLARKAPVRAPGVLQADTGVFAMLTTDSAFYAATEHDLLVANRDGSGWQPIKSLSGHGWRMIAAEGPRVLVGDLGSMMLSIDRGQSFQPIALPAGLTFLGAVAIDAGGRLWAGGREGIFVSETDGRSWHGVNNLFVPDVSGIFFDKAANRLLVTSNGHATIAFAVALPDMQVSHWDTGWHLRMLRPVGDHLLGVTAFDGVVVEPRMINSEESVGTASNPAPKLPSLN